MTERPIGVIGGGPAAGSAALELANAGRRVVLFLPSRAGEKPCGGALPGYLLMELPGFEAGRLPCAVSPASRLENASVSTVRLEMEDLRIFRREDFDRGLVEAAGRAGAQVVREKVRRIEWSSDGIDLHTVESRWRFGWVIAGDGVRGPSRRALRLSPQGESVGLGSSLDGVETSEVILAFPNAGDAYLWIFPRPFGSSVGIAYSPRQLSHGAAHGHLVRFLKRHLAPGAVPRRFGYRYPIPVFGPWTRVSVAAGLDKGVLLVGDAAAVADPLTREGIRPAVRSGVAAAKALLAGRPWHYLDWIEGELAPEMERAARARELFFEGPISQWMVPVARVHPGIRRVLADLLRCAQPYRGLRRRLVGSLFSRG